MSDPLLQLADPVDRPALQAMQHTLDLPAGTVLAEPSGALEGLWLIASGQVESQRLEEAQGEWLPGAVLGEDQLYGTHVLDEGATHSVRLTTLTPVRLVVWPAGALREAARSPTLRPLLAALRHPALRALLPRLAALNPEAARALLASAPTIESVEAGAVVPARGLAVLQAGTVRDEGALLAPGSLIGATAWLLGVEPLALPRAEGPAVVLRWSAVPDATRVALARLATADGGRLRGVAGPDPDQSFVPTTEVEPVPYEAEGRTGPRLFPPFLRQREEMDCGAACLRMVHAWFGQPLSHRFALRLARVSRYGTSLLDLAQAAEQLGYQATGARLESADDLQSVDLPAIAHVDGNHFVVVWRVGRRSVTVSDPAHGRIRIGRAAFAARFTGMVLLLRPTDLVARLHEEDTEIRSSEFTPRRLWPFVKPLKRLLFQVVLASFLIQVLGLAVPFMTQVIIDQVLVHRDASLLRAVLIGLVVLAVMSGLLLFSRSWLLVHGSLQLERNLLTAIYGRVLQASQQFFARFTSGDLMRRMQEVDGARSFFVDNAVQATIDLLMVVTYGAILFLMDGVLAALFGGVLLLTGATSLLLAWPVRGHMFGFQSRMGQADTHVINALKGIEPIKALALERPFAHWYERLLLPGLDHGRQAALWASGSSSAALLLDGVNTALLLGVGADRVLGGELSLGQLMAFLLLARGLSTPFLRLLGQWRAFQSTVVSLYRLGDLLEEMPEGGPGPGSPDGSRPRPRTGLALNTLQLRGEIELAGVTFRYEGDAKDAGKNVLDNVSLHIRPGERVGIVGRSGCGKSTLARLLLRFFEPTGGSIRFDGIHARDLDLATLRGQIGLVTQEAFLYQASIRDNIACGRDVTDEDILRAARAAGAYEFISEMPFGFDTQVGERGLQLSGGQQQRLVIARALCTDPRILVFDEATAALDPVTEAEIHQRLQEVTQGRTTVIIAHRLHTLQHADRIVVLDRGRVVEEGPHAALLAQNGVYARMWNAAPRWEGTDHD